LAVKVNDVVLCVFGSVVNLFLVSKIVVFTFDCNICWIGVFILSYGNFM